MTTGRVLRSSLSTEALRGRVLQSSLSVNTAVRGRVLKARLDAASSSAVRGRVLKASLSVLPSVLVPATVTADSFKLVVLVATLDDGTLGQAWQWEQVSGTTVPRNGSTSIVSFTAPAKTEQATYGFRVRALTAAGWTPWASTTVAVSRHQNWITVAGALVPLGSPDDRTQLQEKPPVDPGVEVPVDPDPPTDPPVEPQPPTGTTPTPGLFFKMPGDIRSRERKVFGHYHVYPLQSGDNTNPNNDYYHRNYLTPTGEGGKYAAVGGLLRDRPIPIGPRNVGSLTGDAARREYLKQFARLEIGWARNVMGMDGMFANLLGLSGFDTWERYVALRNAATQYYPDFYIIPNLDTNGAHGSAVRAGNIAAVAASLKSFSGRPNSYHLPTGQFVVGSFKAEGLTPAQWQAVFDAMAMPTGTKLAATFLSYGLSSPYTAISCWSGIWGPGADPAIVSAAPNWAPTAKSRGLKYLANMTVQDQRADEYWYDNAVGLRSQTAHWRKIISQGADHVQLVTVNDYSESLQQGPSGQAGWVNYDLNAWYSCEWKTGVKPAILRDAIYFAHRNQLLSSVPQYVSPEPMSQRNISTKTPEANIVDIITFLTAPAEITVTAGNLAPVVYTAPAGEYPKTLPLGLGIVSVVARRNGTTVQQLTSNIPVVANPYTEDYGFYKFSSLRPVQNFVPSHPPGVLGPSAFAETPPVL